MKQLANSCQVTLKLSVNQIHSYAPDHVPPFSLMLQESTVVTSGCMAMGMI